MAQPAIAPRNGNGQANRAPSGRMSLSRVTTGRVRAPLRELLYGPEGIGKSTFGADSEAPIVIGPEEGTNQFDIARFPQPERFEDVLEAIRTLGTEEHPYKTLIVDTLDWIEPLIWEHCCIKADVAHIEEIGGGYGKGYAYALDSWRELISHLERLQQKKGMHILLLAHAQIKTFKNPEGDDYDRYSLKLHEKAAGLVKEWCHSVLFANHEVQVKKTSKKASKGKGTSGARWIHTVRTAAYDAKTRYQIPARLPLSFHEFSRASQGPDAGEIKKLKSLIAASIAKLADPKIATTAKDATARAGDDPKKLIQLEEWVAAKLELQADEQEEPKPKEPEETANDEADRAEAGIAAEEAAKAKVA